MWKNIGQGRKKAESTFEKSSMEDMHELYNEIFAAKRDWDNAIRHFSYALGKDQIDYAIFAIEASEKRYEMLLRKAKVLQQEPSRWINVIQKQRSESV